MLRPGGIEDVCALQSSHELGIWCEADNSVLFLLISLLGQSQVSIGLLVVNCSLFGKFLSSVHG